MNTSPLSVEKSVCSISLCYQSNNWKAFGHSACYLASLFPNLKPEEEGEEMRLSLTDENLAEVLYAVDMESVRVEDDRIEIFI